jgi:SAM-dependent methyltransferase
MAKRIAACLLAIWLAAATAVAQDGDATSGQGGKPDLDVPYVATPEEVVERMLELGQVGPGDYVMDLGSGDGRLVIEAVQRGAYGLGVDIDPERVREARKNAVAAGVGDRVAFLQQDLFETDVSQASVVTMYLLLEVNLKLRPILLEELRPGTRVVSHAFGMGDWEADEIVYVKADEPTKHRIYLWVIPADASGRWQWQINGQKFSWLVKQKYQKLDTTLKSDDESLATREVELRGRRIAFSAERDGARYLFSGRIEKGEINGVVQIQSGNEPRVLEWTARRQ